MSTSVINKYNFKTVFAYLTVSVFTFTVDKIYAIFGHGVSSSYMTWMFLYPLIGGVLFFFLLGYLLPGANKAPGYRLFYNLYNSGIALLTVGSLCLGIFEIAGTNSPYVKYYYITGVLFIILALLLMLSIAKGYLLRIKKITK